MAKDKKLTDTYDPDVDYKAIIDDSVAKGDYKTAAQAEQLRNQKIGSLGLDYEQTNKYAGWLDSTDYGTVGQQQMDSGASWQDVLDTYNNRYNKAVNTEGLEQYANDNLQQAMWNYIQEGMMAENTPEPFVQSSSRPTYSSKYDSQIDTLLNQILNRDDFSYDAANDPLYQQYAKMYQREGDRAMRDTMAEAAAGAGGMNSYAVTAAQQAANYYSSQLNDKIPELYQLAYEMYLDDKASDVQDLGLLQGMDETQYGRYRDTMSDWENDRNFAYQQYQDDVAQGNWNKSFIRGNLESDRNFNYNYTENEQQQQADKEATDLANSRYDQETAREEVWKYINLGITPSADLIAKAGMSQSDVALAVAAVQKENKGNSSGGSNGSGGNGFVESDGSGNGYEDDFEIDVSSLGLGKINNELLLGLVDNGLVTIDENGKVYWVGNVNGKNYISYLNKRPSSEF